MGPGGGSTGGSTGGSKSKSKSRGKGVRGSSEKMKKGIRKTPQSNLEDDIEREPWMESQTNWKKTKAMDRQVVSVSNYAPHLLIAKWHIY